MKLYTKRGDYGHTNLVGGRTVSKDHPRVEAYGALDELNSWIGYTMSLLTNDQEDLHLELIAIQHYLFDAGTVLADPSQKIATRITAKDTQWLEEKIDWYESHTPLIESFILPGGSTVSSALQVARTITRRAERNVIHLKNQLKNSEGTESKESINQDVCEFINRLSDYLFTAARWVNHQQGITEPLYERGGKVFHYSEAEKQKRKDESPTE